MAAPGTQTDVAFEDLPSLQPEARVPKGPHWKVVRRALLWWGRGGSRSWDGAAEKRVKLLLVSAWGMGGTIRAIFNLAGYLASRGYDVEVLSIYRTKEQPFFGEFPPGVKVTALDDRRKGHEPRGLWKLVRRWARKRPSVLVHPADRLAFQFNLWSDLQLMRELRGGSGFLVGSRPALNLIIAELKPRGYVLLGEEQMHLRNHDEALLEAMQVHYRKLDLFVCLTKRDARRYRNHLERKVPVRVVPNTVRELPGPKADLSAKRVLAAGRFRAQKGFDRLIPAWAQVHEVHPDWTLRICGSGRLKERLEQLIEHHGLADAVELLPPADMAVEMAEASVFAMSSRFEGFPLTLLEAMSKGMAVVSFDCPTGPADIIDDHANGLIVPRNDVDAFARALIEVCGDEALRRRCGPAAIETAHEYSMDAVGPRWEELLSWLSEKRRAR